MTQGLKFVVAGAVAAALVAGVLIAIYRRRRAAIPEINKHPERLEQMLDPTDDA